MSSQLLVDAVSARLSGTYAHQISAEAERLVRGQRCVTFCFVTVRFSVFITAARCFVLHTSLEAHPAFLKSRRFLCASRHYAAPAVTGRSSRRTPAAWAVLLPAHGNVGTDETPAVAALEDMRTGDIVLARRLASSETTMLFSYRIHIAGDPHSLTLT